MKKPTTSSGRAKDRIVKSLSLPRKLVAKIQAEADAKHKGDFTRAMLTRLAENYPEAAKFLLENTTGKHSKKK